MTQLPVTIQEVAMFTNDVRFIAGRSNLVADFLSRPVGVPLGEAYRLPDPEIASMTTVGDKLDLVSHEDLAKDQAHCPDVQKHREGKCPKSLSMTDVEFSPGVVVYCDVSDGKKSRPLAPAQWRRQIFNMYHQLNHPGQRQTVAKIEAR